MSKGPVDGAYENCNVSCPTHKDASTKIGENKFSTWQVIWKYSFNSVWSIGNIWSSLLPPSGLNYWPRGPWILGRAPLHIWKMHLLGLQE